MHRIIKEETVEHKAKEILDYYGDGAIHFCVDFINRLPFYEHGNVGYTLRDYYEDIIREIKRLRKEV